MRPLLPGAILSILTLPAAAQDWPPVADLLTTRCTFCHSGDYAPLALQLDSHAGVMAGSENGPVVLPGDAAGSPLIHRVTGQAEPRMPLDGPPFLTEAEIALLSDWIGAGAPGPEGGEEASAAPADPRADGIVTYPEIAPILGRACIECHSDDGKMGAPPEGLRLDSYAAVLAGGERLAVIPGNAQASELVRRVEGLADPRMPFDGPPWLAEEEIALLRDWIEGGALSEDGQPAPVPAGAEVRLRGRMTGPSEIDGAAFAITGGTRIDDRPPVGAQAELRARIAADGTLVADRLRAR